MAGIKSGLTLDFKDFERGFEKLMKQSSVEAIQQGLFKAGNELLSDAIRVAPMAPKDVGDLRGSATVTQAKVSGSTVSLEAGFNIVYARKWHEVPLSQNINWTTDKGASSPGPKYLQSKMLSNKERYLRIIGEFLWRLLHSGGGK